MRIAEILRRKGDEVATARPHQSVADLVIDLRRYNIGAMVVRDEAETILGIVSERDVVRRLAEQGNDLLERPISAIMTRVVVTCDPDDTVDDLTLVMTERRIRHVPVVREGELVGIVSIGDVVKSRISQLEDDRRHLEAYIFR
ncbi:CBS domain-containing protein [Spiractinospora alimapuensis]|uniref:CBS domain-containing protein n=1 Tax=Spiractinospora alimapuensis TaxID=2820884 RepID=UPI001F3CFB2C|nr:CBS domain-containing protein [Spiractinospora alimapuensis]QVQ51991.1 CBS domain-containing protein [Spiractinospora alimapuensis]